MPSRAQENYWDSIVGRMCHVELMFQVQYNKWYRYGIVKKAYDPKRSKETGKTEFIWGTTHFRPTDRNSWDSKYKFLVITVARERQQECYDFIMSQRGKPFNYYAYVMNAFVQGGLGISEYHPALKNDLTNSWFCSQLVGVALQLLGDDEDFHSKYTNVGESQAMRALRVVAVNAIAAGAGAGVGIACDLVSSVPVWAAVIIGVFAAFFVSSFVDMLFTWLGDLYGARGSFYRSFAKRHPHQANDWTVVVGSFSRWHQSNPNMLYDMLSASTQVHPWHDPNGEKISLKSDEPIDMFEDSDNDED